MNDVGSNIVFTIVDSSGNIVSLASASTVRLKVSINNTFNFDRVVNFLDRNMGQVFYTIQSGDLPSTGMARMELLVGFTNGNIFTTSRIYEIVEPIFSF
jgi:hypothetical protein